MDHSAKLPKWELQQNCCEILRCASNISGLYSLSNTLWGKHYWQDIKVQLCHQQTPAQKTCHSISISLISGQGREQCETAGYSVTACILSSKTITSYFCRSLWLLISHSPQLSSLDYKPCLTRKHLSFPKVKQVRQQSTVRRQKAHQYGKSCSVISLVNYTKLLLQRKLFYCDCWLLYNRFII